MSQLFRRLLSRLYADRDRLARRRMGEAAEKLCWLALDVGASTPNGGTDLPDIVPQFVDARELQGHPELFWMQRETVERMLADGGRCMAMRDRSEIVYRAVVTTDPARAAEVAAQHGISDPAWLVSGVLVHPAHRGRHLNAAAMTWLAGEARRSGARYLVAWVAEWNRSSLRAFERAGFVPIGEHGSGTARP